MLEKSKVQLPNQKYPNTIEAGCDEAGRGCIAGPVTAAAVVLPENLMIKGLNDSKKLSERRREELAVEIKEKALAWHVAFLDHEEIDAINILNASFKAMNICIHALAVKPHRSLIDGNRFKGDAPCEIECVVKGDGKFANIAAASILAKTERDAYMKKIHEEFPQYNWKKNKGYPTAAHQQAVMTHGLSPIHRKSFNCIPRQLELNFA